MSDVLFMVNCYGIGDTLASTPVIEYFCKMLAKHDGDEPPLIKRVDVWTHHPEIFKGSPFVDRLFTGDKQPQEEFFRQWHPVNIHICYPLATIPPLRVSHSHLVDFQSSAAINSILPAAEKNYRMHILESDVQNTAKKHRLKGKKWIALHPGYTWKTRSLPRATWQEVLDLLIANVLDKWPDKYGVVLFGKDLKMRGANALNPRGRADVLDLINETTLTETICVLKHCWGIVCTDSGAICMAGLTDAHLFSILTLHPAEYRAPYRNGTTNYKLHIINNRESSCLYCGLRFVREDKNLANCINYANEMECMPSASEIVDSILAQIRKEES